MKKNWFIIKNHIEKIYIFDYEEIDICISGLVRQFLNLCNEKNVSHYLKIVSREILFSPDLYRPIYNSLLAM
jgi:hypothetical protein